MDQYTNKRQSQFLYNLIANPANQGQEYMNDLQQLVKNFPQSGILQAMLAHANGALTLHQAAAYFDPPSLYKVLKNPEELPVVQPGQVFYQSGAVGLKYQPQLPPQTETKTPVAKEKAVAEEEATATVTAGVDQLPAAAVEEEIAAEEKGEEIIVEDKAAPVIEEEKTEETGLQASAETTEQAADEDIYNEQAGEVAEDTPGDIVVAEEETAAESTDDAPAEEIAVPEVNDLQAPEAVAEKTVEDAINPEELSEMADEAPVEEKTVVEEPAESIDNTPSAETAAAEEIAVVAAEVEEEVEYPQEDEDAIEDEVYDEIVSIDDINIEEVKQGSYSSEEAIFTFSDPFSEQETEHLTSETDDAQAEHGFKLDDEADKLIVGNIAATDYFMFDRAFGKLDGDEVVSEAEPEASPEPEPAAQTSSQPQQITAETEMPQEAADVARYHDEKMPYSFLWWLDKTRKEHAGVYQPYAPNKPASAADNATPDPLQQQYYENIFHITSVDELDKHTAGNETRDVKHKGDEIIERFIKEEPQIRPTNTERLDNENKAKKSSEDQNDLVTETLANIYAEQMLYPKAIAIYKKLMLKFPEKSRYFADRIKNLEKKTS